MSTKLGWMGLSGLILSPARGAPAFGEKFCLNKRLLGPGPDSARLVDNPTFCLHTVVSLLWGPCLQFCPSCLPEPFVPAFISINLHIHTCTTYSFNIFFAR